MREVINQVYTFKELDAEAQDKAIKQYIENIDWGIESEYISEVFQEELKKLGYPTDEVPWSLNYCQGDGVAFYGVIDVDKVAKRLLSESDYEFLMEHIDEFELELDIIRNGYGHRYSHWNTMVVEMELTSYSDRLEFDGCYDYGDVDEYLSEKILKITGELLVNVKSDVVETSKELERKGYDIIDGIQSEENARDYLENSDEEYYENGKWYAG